MTTALLSPLLPDADGDAAARILEVLEEEVQTCGALFGLLIDRAGQVIAADAPGSRLPRRRLVLLAAYLVPIFIASRAAAHTAQGGIVEAPLMERAGVHLVTQPILDAWLVAMAYPIAATPPDLDTLREAWLTSLRPLVPARKAAHPRRSRQTIRRDGVDLLFRDDDDEVGDAQKDTERWR